MKHLNEAKENLRVESDEEESFEFIRVDAPIFENNAEIFIAKNGETFTVNSRYCGEECYAVEWYHDGQIVESK